MKEKLQSLSFVHVHALLSSLGRLTRAPLTTLVSVFVMAISIALAGVFYLVVVNLQQVSENMDNTNQLSLFLKPAVTEQEALFLKKSLEFKTEVASVVYISKDQGFEDFRRYSGFGEALNVLEENPLPIVLQVIPNDEWAKPKDIQRLQNELGRLPEVEFVQMDMDWLKKFYTLVDFLHRASVILSLVLGVGVIFVTGNTIRLELQDRKNEVEVLKLVGATHGFIQRPFLYTGLWLGMMAGLFALIIIILIVQIVKPPLVELFSLYGSEFNMILLGFSESLIVIGCSVCLGMLGSWLVLQHQLHLIKPQ